MLCFYSCADLFNDPNEDDEQLPSLDPKYNPYLIFEVIDINVNRLMPGFILESSNPNLINEIIMMGREAVAPPNPIDVFIGFTDAVITSPDAVFVSFDKNNPDVLEMFELLKYDISNNPDLNFYAVNMMFVEPFDPLSPEGNKIRVPAVDYQSIVDYKSDTTTGGCCAVLAVAHSLVRKMGRIVPKDSVVKKKDGKEYWDPEFLKKIWKNSGDDDNSRGLTDEEAEKAHSADYSSTRKQTQIDDDKQLYDNDAVSCDKLKARYEELKKRLDANNDVTMRIAGYDGEKSEGKDWGHRVMVTGVTWNEGPPCSMEIKVLKTSVQEPRGQKKNFENIPFEPNEGTYKIETGSDGKTKVTQTEFNNSETVTKLSYDTFKSEKK